MNSIPRINAKIECLLTRWSDGDQSCESELMELIYPHIHALAKREFKSVGSNQLQTTELVNEAFIQLSQSKKNWKNQSHFLAITSKVIKQILIQKHRAEHAQKRGSGMRHLTVERLEHLIDNNPSSTPCWYELSSLLEELKQIDELAADVVLYKVFGGMTRTEIADVLKISESNVSRLWSFARLWLLARMK